MNSLNARVSSVRTQENPKKNSPLRFGLVTLPPSFKFSNDDFCVTFKSATTVQEQVKVVNDLFRRMYVDDQVLRFLVQLFYSSPLKHPLRNQLIKIFTRSPTLCPTGFEAERIQNMFAETILYMIANKNEDSAEWNNTIASIYASIATIPFVLTAVTLVYPQLINFLSLSVDLYLKEIRLTNVPSKCNQYYTYLMNTGYCLLTLIKRSQTQTVAATLMRIKNRILVEMISNENFPMDLRVILAQFVARLSQNQGELNEFFALGLEAKSFKEAVLFQSVSLQVVAKDEIFKHIFDVFAICDNLLRLLNSEIKFPQDILCAARSLQHLAKVILLATKDKRQIEIHYDQIENMLCRLVMFVCLFVEHNMDTVRHICRETLENVVNASREIDCKNVIGLMYEQCELPETSVIVRTTLLHQLTLAYQSEEVLLSYPKIFQDLFDPHLGKEPPVNNLYEALLVSSYKIDDNDFWFDTWLEYLFKRLTPAPPSDDLLLVIEKLLHRAIILEPKIVSKLLTEQNLPMRSKLSLLWIVRKNGLKVGNINALLKKFQKNIEDGIIAFDDDVRIMALRVLVETNKSTAPITQLELENILKYVEYDINTQSPDTRQKSLALLTKCLKRCEVQLLKFYGTQNHLAALEAREEPLPVQLYSGMLFLLSGNLFESANFSRRSSSLQLLKQCVEIGINCNLSLENLMPNKVIVKLVGVFSDSYESNCELAVTILKSLDDKWDHQLANRCAMLLNPNEVSSQLRSVRPNDCVASAYALELWCNANLTLHLVDEYCDLPNYMPSYYAALKWLMKLLKADLQVAAKSISEAAKRGPLYGIIFVIRHLLSRLSYDAFVDNIPWRILIADLIVCCREATTAVAPIVNSSSPEGHLPNDFSELSDALDRISISNNYSASENNDDTSSIGQSDCKILTADKKQPIDLDKLRTTPQMVLLCGWRTVKEVSLLLGDIVLRAPVQEYSVNFVLAKEQILEIGEHFKSLLSETKHRGAFEQAYVGFSKFASRLWRFPSADLSELPLQWLAELHALILGKQENLNKKLCATRRSAGLPFMVQALITSERQMGTTKALNCSMVTLFAVCANRSAENVESRTHALNILRALFRCADLKEDVAPFVAEGVRWAILSYGSETWGEKNSGTLLFAALINRIFGVQREKDAEELNVRNKMTGRIFFLRYPTLYDFFVEQLKSSSIAVREQRKTEELLPLLMILSRLYPSALEGTENNFRLSHFINPIFHCLGSHQISIRKLAAKAFVALHSKDGLYSCSTQLFKNVLEKRTDDSDVSLNNIHGRLLLINTMQKSIHVEQSINELLIATVVALLPVVKNNLVVLKAMFDILVSCMEQIPKMEPEHVLRVDVINLSCIQLELAEPYINYYPVAWTSQALFKLHVFRACENSELIFASLINPLVKVPVNVEQILLSLQVFCVLVYDDEADKVDLSNLDVKWIAGVDIFVKQIELTMKKKLIQKIRHQDTVQHFVKQLLELDILHPQGFILVYAILAKLETFDLMLDELLDASEKHSSDIQAAVALCVERVVKEEEFGMCKEFLEYLYHISQSWQPYSLRLRATSMLSVITPLYIQALDNKYVEFVTIFIKLMLMLVLDDDMDVRKVAMLSILRLIHEPNMEATVPLMAQRLFLRLTADHLACMNASIEYIGDILSTILSIYKSGGGGNDEDYDGDDSLEVFDKNESNVFAEPLTSVLDALIIFRDAFVNRKNVVDLINTLYFKLEGNTDFPEFELNIYFNNLFQEKPSEIV